MTSFTKCEIAKRAMSAEKVNVVGGDVVVSDRVNADGQFQAVRFSANGNCVDGLWSPGYAAEFGELLHGQPGTFTEI